MSMKDFQIINKIGDGAYSLVYKVKRISDGQEYALKKVKMMALNEKEKQNALNEVRILASINHPNIIGYKEAFFEDSSSSLCLVMEYANDGDLYEKIKNHTQKRTVMSENMIWGILISMVRALRMLHSMKIFHRDLKCANVFLFKDGTAKLGDLNVSKVAAKGLLYTQTGTPYYASPEVWKDSAYDSKSDIWSLGCVLYEMTTLKPPFQAKDMNQLYQKVCKGIYPQIPSNYSQELNQMIKSLLQVSPSIRPSCETILKMEIVKKRLHLAQGQYQEQPDNTQELYLNMDNNNLLSTIKVPRNLAQLTKNLPKSNYISSREKIKQNTHKHDRLSSVPALEVFPQLVRDLRIGNQDSASKADQIINQSRNENMDAKRIIIQQKALNQNLKDEKININLNNMQPKQGNIYPDYSKSSQQNKSGQKLSTESTSRDLSSNNRLSDYLKNSSQSKQAHHQQSQSGPKRDFFAELRLPQIQVNQSAIMLSEQSKKNDEGLLIQRQKILDQVYIHSRSVVNSDIQGSIKKNLSQPPGDRVGLTGSEQKGMSKNNNEKNYQQVQPKNLLQKDLLMMKQSPINNLQSAQDREISKRNSPFW